MAGDDQVTEMIIHRLDRFEESVYNQLEKHGDRLDTINTSVKDLDHQIRLQNGRVKENENSISQLWNTWRKGSDRLDTLEEDHSQEEAVDAFKAKQWRIVRWALEHLDRILAAAAAAAALLISLS